jgi:acyl carrier protein
MHEDLGETDTGDDTTRLRQRAGVRIPYLVRGITRTRAGGSVMSTMMMEAGISDEDILDRLREVLRDTFEIDPARVTPSAQLFTDLELDSIDAVDLAIQVQEMTGMRIKPEDFKSVRTVGDVIATVHNLLAR